MIFYRFKKTFILACYALIILTISGCGSSKSSSKHPYKFAVCCMFKDEARWLKEWIDYHHEILKVDHFYLYNNDSSDNYLSVLSSYIEKGLVEVIDWPSIETNAFRGFWDVSFVAYQFGAFRDCLKKRALGKARWVAVIDVDEFIVPVKGAKSLHTLLDKYADSDVGSMMLYWRVFGTSHIWDLNPDELLTKKLTKRFPDKHSMNRIIKSIHRPETVRLCTVHDGKLYKEYRRKRLSPKDFRINHYWTRTEKCFYEKRKFSKEEQQKILNECNLVEDTSILKLLKN